jgi:succinate dehydrogenase/fumarate reductase flavoprotein subunit
LKNRIQWHKEAEVVVVGFGGAGGVSAITAHDEGAEVVILEKQPLEGHITNTSMSGGIFIVVNDIPQATSYMEKLYQVEEGLSWTDKDILQVWAEYCSRNREWIERIGGHTKLSGISAEHKLVPGSESIELHRSAGHGYALQRWLKENVKSRGIEVVYDTPAEKLLTNFNGEVIGVRAQREGEEFNVKASKAVIMALGGFEYDDELKLNYLKVYPTHFTGSPANTGDGIRMVQDVGASLWHMNCCSARLVAKFPDFRNSFDMDFGGRAMLARSGRSEKAGATCAFIIVDKYGRRYTNEGEIRGHALYYELALYDSHHMEYPRVPSYWIFDVNRIKAGPLAATRGATGAHRLYKWSKDNRVELEKGWILQGDTLRELAHKLNMESDTLEKTVKTYNTYCEHNEDPEFHRSTRNLQPLKDSPFFAVRLWPGGPNTQGGPRRNRKGQVLDVDKNPIPRLYAAGEFGSIYGLIYPSAGGNIAECIAFGQIAGENAAKEHPLP